MPKVKGGISSQKSASSRLFCHPLARNITQHVPRPRVYATEPKTIREYYNCIVEQKYPGITIRHELDLLILGSGGYKGPFNSQDIHKFCDKELNSAVNGNEVLIPGELMKWKKFFEGPVDVIGNKPALENTDVKIRPIPGTEYSIRLWGSLGADERREYYMDFLDSTGKPINSPFEFELWAQMPALSFSITPEPMLIRSLENVFGVETKDIAPGHEKFALLEGQWVTIIRKDREGSYLPDICFQVPVRPREEEVKLANENRVVLDFDEA